MSNALLKRSLDVQGARAAMPRSLKTWMVCCGMTAGNSGVGLMARRRGGAISFQRRVLAFDLHV